MASRRRGGGNSNRFGGGRSNNNNFGGSRNRNQQQQQNTGGHEQPDARLCKFFLLGGAQQCQSGHKSGGCQFAHSLQRVADVLVAKNTGQRGRGGSSSNAVTAVCSHKDESGGVRVFTGTKDGHWRMWNALSWQLEQDVAMEGEVHALEVAAGFLVCGYEGPTPTLPGVTVGLVRAWNLANPATPYDFHISSEMPFAHLQRTYSVQLKIDTNPEVYTGSHDGAIHCWGFDAAQNKFHLKQKLEGHVLGVTSLSLFTSGGTFLLSGSMDRSVRVWSVDSDPKACQGLLTKNNSGHSDVVTSVTTLSMGEAQYFLTGSMDRHVKVWNSSGGCDHDQSCGGPVLSLCTTVDPGQKQIVLVGLVDGTIELRQPDLGFRLRATLSNRFSVGHPDQLKALCAGDGYFCSGGADAKLMVWQWVGPLPPGR